MKTALLMLVLLSGCSMLKDSQTRNIRATASCEDGSYCECSGEVVKDLTKHKVEK